VTVKTATTEVRCSRCSGARWIPGALAAGGLYACLRCRVVLAGQNATDPLRSASPAMLDALRKASSERFQRGNSAPGAEDKETGR